MMLIFLDETGQLSKNKDGEYFILGTFTIGDQGRTQKKFAAWKKKKFPPKLKFLSEVKFTDNGIDDELRLKTISEISKLDVRIRFSYVKKSNIPLSYRHKNGIRTGHLYTDIVSKTLDLYLPTTEKIFRVFCDNRNLKGITKSEFKSIISSHIQSQLQLKSIVQIELVDSTTNINIQIADWICGALDRYFNKKEHGDEFFALLKNNLLGDGVEIFRDTWVVKQKTQSVD